MSTVSASAFLATVMSIAYLQRCLRSEYRNVGPLIEDNTDNSSSLKAPDDDDQRELQQFLANDHKIYKFVLTGGPCSGKTTAMERLQVFLRERGAMANVSCISQLFI